MRTILACLFIAMAWSVAATQTIDSWIFNDSPRNLFLASPASGHWGTLTRFHNAALPERPGYDPQCTVLFTSWKPIVKEVAPHRWQVTFEIPPAM